MYCTDADTICRSEIENDPFYDGYPYDICCETGYASERAGPCECPDWPGPDPECPLATSGPTLTPAPMAATCVNDDSTTDNGGDTCSEWYDRFPESCGSYDDDDFTASERCCACGGGEGTFAPTATSERCVDDLSTTGQFDKSCSYFDYWPGECGKLDDEDFTASVQCCACGGGLAGGTPAPRPSPSPTATPENPTAVPTSPRPTRPTDSSSTGGSRGGGGGPNAAAMGGGVAAGALVLLLTAGAFVFYRRTVARDAKANAGPGVVDEAGGLEAPPQTALITSKVDEPPPPPAPGLLARALSRRGSDAAAAAPPPAPAAAPTTTVRGKKRGPVKGATAKADSKIRMVFAPMAAWYHDPARGALRQRHGAYPATPDALANWKSFGAVTTAFLDDQGVASTGAPAASAAEPPAAAPPAAAPVTAPSAPPAPEARGWFGWGAGGDPASPSPPLDGVLVTPPTAVPVTVSVVASPVSRAAAPPRNFCPSCGNRLADGANFCMACGRSVSS